MSVFRKVSGGIELLVRATPKGGRDALGGIAALSDGREVLKVRVRAAPEDGAATAAVGRVIASALGVSASRVVLIAGATARVKTFRVEGDADALAEALVTAEPDAAPTPDAVAPATPPPTSRGGRRVR